MSARRKRDPLEVPYREGGRVPAGAPPPGRDPILGKQAVRCIAERIHGTIEQIDFSEYVVTPTGKRRSIPLEQLVKKLHAYEGWKIEVTVYQDHDPDVLSRMAEAVGGMDGALTWEGSPYPARIRHELQECVPGFDYDVALVGEEIQITRRNRSGHVPRFRLDSPRLGSWRLFAHDGIEWYKLDDRLTFLDALTTMVEHETAG